EAAVPGIYDGLEKEIIWADPMVHARTPLSIVYIHGFSASKGEVRPLPDEVADQLDANLYYTRLTGHGQGGAAMAEGSVNAWINDYEEALAIGRAIGDKVIVIATSTGGSLAAWAATQPDASEGMAAVVFMPWGREIAELVAGKERSFVPRNALHEKFWTHRYPIAATLPMVALTELAYGALVEKATIPALFIFSDSDR
ncbi:MAG: alpha/beta hydrolase, partial [Mesorhizobium sp.]